MRIYSVRDSKTEIYNTPFVCLTDGQATRNFGQLALDPQSSVSKYPEDYTLYYIGTFNEVSGLIEPDTPVHIISATGVRSLYSKQNDD